MKNNISELVLAFLIGMLICSAIIHYGSLEKVDKKVETRKEVLICIVNLSY